VAARAKELYYKQMFDSKMNTVKKLWDNLNVVCSFKTKKSRNNVDKLVMDDQTLVDSYEISNGFNKYFRNIGQTLAKKFNKDLNMNFRYYLNNLKKDSMFCEPLEAEELCKLIENLNVKKYPGPDGFGPKLIKEIAPLIFQPVLYLFTVIFLQVQAVSRINLNWLRLFPYLKRVINIYLVIIDPYHC